MSFFKKLFSSSYRQALALEGAGRYREAAQQYMLCGERGQVARMHRLAARDEHDPYARVDALRKALDFIDRIEEPEDVLIQRELRRELADALVRLAEHSGLLDRRDRSLLEEAAAIYTEHDAANEAGEAYAKLGFHNKAAEAFKRAGNIKRMEEMFSQVEAVDVSEAAFDRAWDAYEFAQMAGDPIGTIEALTRCVELKPQDAGLMASLQQLKERIPRCGRITARSSHGAWILVGGRSLGIGREDDNEILIYDPGVSRQHATIALGDSGGPELTDLGSSHGTWVGGRRLERPRALTEEGEFQIGKDVRVRYRFRPGMQPPGIFTIASGHLKGQSFVWTPRVLTTGIPPDEPEWMPAGLAFEFQRGYWHIVPEMCAGPVSIGGVSLSVHTLLRIGDEITFDGKTLKVD